MQSYSKGSRGLFVPLRVIGIFTDTTISPSSRLRQYPDRYTIRAGRNLRPLFRSYRTILPSSLTANHSSALVYSTQPPVSVYGTGNHAICLADFLGSTVTVVHISLCKHSEYCQVRISERICLLRSTPTPFNQLFRQLAGPSHLRLHIAHIISTGILTGSSIGCALECSPTDVYTSHSFGK